MRWTTQVGAHYVPMQFDVRHDPWKLLVTCTLLRQATGAVAKPVLSRFFERWPDPRDFYEANDPQDVVDVIRPCGLHNIRLITLVDLTTEYLGFITTYPRFPHWRDVQRWKGAGDYTVQSYMIFIDREDPREWEHGIADHVLAKWLDSPLWPIYRATGDLLIPERYLGLLPSEETTQ